MNSKFMFGAMAVGALLLSTPALATETSTSTPTTTSTTSSTVVVTVTSSTTSTVMMPNDGTREHRRLVAMGKKIDALKVLAASGNEKAIKKLAKAEQIKIKFIEKWQKREVKKAERLEKRAVKLEEKRLKMEEKKSKKEDMEHESLRSSSSTPLLQKRSSGRMNEVEDENESDDDSSSTSTTSTESGT